MYGACDADPKRSGSYWGENGVSEIVNKEAADTIVDLHNGLHIAITALIHYRDYDKDEFVPRQMDDRLARLRRMRFHG